MTKYVNATVSPDQGGSLAGKDVEILADDYAAKGDEEMIEVKVGDDIVFIEKKYITPKSDAMDTPGEPKVQLLDEEDDDLFDLDIEDNLVDEPETPAEEEEDDETEIEGMSKHDFPTLGDMYIENPSNDLEVLRAKLQKSLEELEEIKADMATTFTSTDTISTTIQSVKGMLDALKKDNDSILSKR